MSISTDDNLIGRWGRYPWFDEHGVEMIHPDDLAAFRPLVLSGAKMFQCVAADDQYLTIRYQDHRFRVKPNLFRSLPTPDKTWGAVVHLRKGEAILSGIVCDLMWHGEKQEPFYFVAVEGTRLQKRYFRADFLDEDTIE